MSLKDKFKKVSNVALTGVMAYNSAPIMSGALLANNILNKNNAIPGNIPISPSITGNPIAGQLSPMLGQSLNPTSSIADVAAQAIQVKTPNASTSTVTTPQAQSAQTAVQKQEATTEVTAKNGANAPVPNDTTKSLNNFLTALGNLGTVVKCRYQVEFEPINNITFYLANISTPSIKRNFTDLSFEGKKIEIPINYEYNHDFTMTVLNDSKGYFYNSAIELIKNENNKEKSLVDSGYKLIVHAYDDDVKSQTSGFKLILEGVRFKSVSGLDFSPASVDLETFIIDCSCIKYSFINK